MSTWWLLAVLLVAGCGSGRVVGGGGSETSSPVTREFGFIRSADPAARTIAFDPAEWLTGPAAASAAAEDGKIEPGQPVPNDYYIRNPDTATRTLKVIPTTKITGAAPATRLNKAGPPCDNCVRYELSVDRFFQVLEGQELGQALKVWITSHGTVATKIEEQYTP